MSFDATFEMLDALLLPTRFILVNDRVPRADTTCALCCAKIEHGYVREPYARQVYCDMDCFAAHRKLTLRMARKRQTSA